MIGIVSKSRGFQTMLSLGWPGQSGNVAPSRMMISWPQHTLLYTPNLSLISPFWGMIVDIIYHMPSSVHIKIGVILTATATFYDRNGLVLIPVGQAPISG